MSGRAPALGLWVVVAAALAAPCLGCGLLSEIGPANCDRSEEGNPPIRYTEGTVESGVYMSAAWDTSEATPQEERELLYFPGGMHYEIEHKLGETPRWVQAYLSFDRYGAQSESLAPAAGNQTEIHGINAETVTVVNASCVEYWLLVVAGAGETTVPEGLPD